MQNMAHICLFYHVLKTSGLNNQNNVPKLKLTFQKKH
jgi:hypothetical protein